MIRLLIYAAIIILTRGLESDLTILRDYDVMHVVSNHNTCSKEDAKLWATDFEDCFVSRKYTYRPDLFNIVPRLMDHSKNCMKYATMKCRPNYQGFLLILGKAIELIKEYSRIYAERLISAGTIAVSERDKIQDLNCVENVLTKDSYANCFKIVAVYEQLLDESERYDLIFQREIERAISCANRANNQCSESLKITLNKLVRYILGVNQPRKDDIEIDQKSSEPPNSLRRTKFLSDPSNIEKDKEQNGSTILEFLNSTEPPKTTILVREKEDNDDYIKIIKASKSSEYPEKKDSEDDLQFTNLPSSSSSTETIEFSDSLKHTNASKYLTESIEKHTESLEPSELTEAPRPSNLVKSTEFPKVMESSHIPVTEKIDDNVTVTFSTLEYYQENDDFVKIINSSKSSSGTLEKENIQDDQSFTSAEIPTEDTGFTKFESSNLTLPNNSLQLTEFPKHLESSASSVTERSDDFTSTTPPKSTQTFHSSSNPKTKSTVSRSKTTMTIKYAEFSVSSSPVLPTSKGTVRQHRTTPKYVDRQRTTKPSTKPSDPPRRSSVSVPKIERTTAYERPRPTEPPKKEWRWYDYIIQPIISAWKAVTSWFGW